MNSQSQNFKYAFLVVSFIGFICCPDRSDFNVALGIFAFMLWSQSHFPQKHRILWVLLLSLVGDLLWIILVGVVRWGQEPLDNNNLRTLTQIASIVNMVYKIILIIFAMCRYPQCSDLFSCSSFKTKMLFL